MSVEVLHGVDLICDDKANLMKSMPQIYLSTAVDAIKNVERSLAQFDDDSLLSQPSTLTDKQEQILSVLCVTSGALSILGSLTIVYNVVQKRYVNTTSYDRLILGLSLADIVASLSFIFSPFFVPSETSQRVWAMGSQTTCSFLGWMTQFGLAAVWYNALLSFYYLFTVRLRIPRDIFAKKYEKWFHLSAWIFFSITASIGSTFDWYSEFQINQGCWLGEIPKGCEASETCTGTGLLVGWIFGGVPMLITFLALTINNILIYVYVRDTLRPTTTGRPSFNDATTRTDTVDGARKSRPLTGGISLVGQASHTPEEEELDRPQQTQVREVASQGFLYVGTFFMSYTPAFVVRLVDGIGLGTSDEARIFPLLVLNSFLLPLQGFFNMFVHTRPRYLRFHAAFPEKSRLWIMSHALFDKDIPRYPKVHYKSRGGSVNHSCGLSKQRSRNRPSSSYSSSSYLDGVEEEKGQDEDDFGICNWGEFDEYITFVLGNVPSGMTSISQLDDDVEDSPKVVEHEQYDNMNEISTTDALQSDFITVEKAKESLGGECAEFSSPEPNDSLEPSPNRGTEEQK